MDSSGDVVEAILETLKDKPDNVRQKVLSTIHELLPTFSPPADKKLKDLPDNVRQKVLSMIHELLTTFSPPAENFDGCDTKPKLKRGRPRKRSPTGEQKTSMKEPTMKNTFNDWSDDDEIVVNAVQTSRGRNTKRIDIASLMKSARRSTGCSSGSGGSSGSRRKGHRKKPKVEEESQILPLIKTEIVDKDDLEENTYDTKHDIYVTAKEEKLSDMEGDENDIIAVEGEFDNETPSENIENINTKKPLQNNEKKGGVQSHPGARIPKVKSSPVKRGLSIQNRAHRTITSSGKAVYKCPECGKSFAQSSELHLKRHRGERDFPCSECSYRAFTKIDLMRHNTIHTGERNHVCQYCGKAYAKDSTLRDHVTAMHERKVRHVCNQCGFATHRANNLRVHIRMRHHGEYNNHVCPVCQASIKQKSAFLEHMRSHTGERPFQCDRCPAAFACTARLNVHRNSVHGERQFQCEYCPKCFQTKHHLLRHEAVHTKARPYACPFCSYACNTQGNMAKHVRTIHKKPDYSYRKYKEQQENGGQPRPVDPDWVEKGNKLTEKYLKELSEKLGRPITLDELWKRQEEIRVQKLTRAIKDRPSRNGSEHSYHCKNIQRKRADLRAAAETSEVKQLPTVEKNENSGEVGEENQEEEEEEERHPSIFNWLTNNGNIQLCLETKELQVYTGDATREGTRPNELEETIQGYMNEQGHFIRFNNDVLVNDDDSTVVVIINSEDMQESAVQPDDILSEPSELRVTPISPDVHDVNQQIVLVQQDS